MIKRYTNVYLLYFLKYTFTQCLPAAATLPVDRQAKNNRRRRRRTIEPVQKTAISFFCYVLLHLLLLYAAWPISFFTARRCAALNIAQAVAIPVRLSVSVSVLPNVFFTFQEKHVLTGFLIF